MLQRIIFEQLGLGEDPVKIIMIGILLKPLFLVSLVLTANNKTFTEPKLTIRKSLVATLRQLI